MGMLKVGCAGSDGRGWDWEILGLGDTGTGRYWDWEILGLGDTGTGRYRDWEILGLGGRGVVGLGALEVRGPELDDTGSGNTGSGDWEILELKLGYAGTEGGGTGRHRGGGGIGSAGTGRYWEILGDTGSGVAAAGSRPRGTLAVPAGEAQAVVAVPDGDIQAVPDAQPG